MVDTDSQHIPGDSKPRHLKEKPLRFRPWQAPKGRCRTVQGASPGKRRAQNPSPEWAEQPADKNAHNIAHTNSHADLMCKSRGTCFALQG